MTISQNVLTFQFERPTYFDGPNKIIFRSVFKIFRYFDKTIFYVYKYFKTFFY